ncbi:MAG: quinohemoprotein amine dehydrogenase subunit alpha [Bryobacteraceae bacterium]
MSITKWAGATALFLFGATGLFAQTAPQGIPIDDPTVIRKCGGCHQRDSSGMMRRLSYIRTSPEVWEQAIKRMIRINGLTATPAEIRDVMKYLSANNGLAPEEMKNGFWEVEHRTVGYNEDFVPAPALQKTCNTCHNIGRVLSQRRTKDDYDKLINMHLGLFPSAMNILKPAKAKAVPVDMAAQRMITNAAGGIQFEQPRATPAGDAKFPAETAVDWLSANQPLITPEWTAWKAAMKTPKLVGTWLLTGEELSKGKVFGKMTITQGGAEDQFTTAVEMTYATTGNTVKTTGRSIVYTGYSWRGRESTTPNATPTLTAAATPTEWREALMVSRDGNSIDGRFFWSSFGELGIDVHLSRMGSEPTALGTDISGLQSPSKATVKIFGANLGSLKTADVDFGKGITVSKIVTATPGVATVEVDVAKGLAVGYRDLVLGKSTAVGAFAVYDKIGYIEVGPDAQISRLGGIKYPKNYAQYEATAWAAGPDGKLHTDDDVSLGPVQAQWVLEEFYSTPDDDDTKFVGNIDDSGFFTPNVEGPNEQRKKQANNFGVNNFGDVWVAASYQAPDGTKFKAKSYLVVTVPDYTMYDQPEVAQ